MEDGTVEGFDDGEIVGGDEIRSDGDLVGGEEGIDGAGTHL